MDPPYQLDIASQLEIERVRERNRIAKRKSRARRRQNQDAVQRDGSKSRSMDARGDALVRNHEVPGISSRIGTSRSPIANGDGSSAGTLGNVGQDNESLSSIHLISSVDLTEENGAPTPNHITVSPLSPPDHSLRLVQFEDRTSATCPVTDASDFDLTHFGILVPLAGLTPNTTSPNSSPFYMNYQQPAKVNTRRASSNSVSNRSSSPGILHLAVRNGSRAIAQALLVAGASANSRDNSGAFPLHLAVQNRRRSMADLLLTHGADPDVVDTVGMTPLELAVQYRDEDMVRLLISRGARVT
ncbi:hypothetical protein VTK56DRAFT_5776 [Thermocarpiscus australiensis]